MRSDPADIPVRSRRSARTPALRLREALCAMAGGRAETLHHGETNWASITFSGTRHRLRLRFAGAEGVAAGERLIDALPDHEFAIPRQLVADAQVLEVEHTLLPEPEMRVTVELLLLEEG